MNAWRSFWNPGGKGYLLFFFKFFVFTFLAWMLWRTVRIPYNHILKSAVISLTREKINLLDIQFDPDRGILALMCGPFTDSPIPLQKFEPVTFKVNLNVAHYNFIPFIALLLASPWVSRRRLIVFLIAGTVILNLTHIFHVYNGIRYYYFQTQDTGGYFKIQKLALDSPQFTSYRSLKVKISVFRAFFGLMEQAGSMIVPAFLWFVYASGWILKALRSPGKNPHVTEPAETTE